MIKKIIYSLLITVLVFSSFALAQDNSTELKSAEDLFATALNNYNQENYTLAAEHLNSLLTNNDLSEELEFRVLYYSTMTAVKRYRTNEAVDFLNKFNQAGFQNGNLNWQIGKLFLNKNERFDSADFPKALTYLKEAEELGLEKLEFKRDLAYAHSENQNLETAAEIYQEIVKEKAVTSDYLGLASIKEKQNNLSEAAEYYELARDLDGKTSALHLNLGNLYQKLDDYDSAVSVYEEGTQLRDDFAPLYIGLAESQLELENYSEAEKALKRAVKINENSYYGYYLLGNIEKQRKNYDKALDYYSQALENNQNYVKAYLAEGKVHLERDEHYKAISRLSLAVEKNPDYAESHYYLGQAYYKADMLEAAASEFRKTLHINDKFPEARDLLDEIEKNLENS